VIKGIQPITKYEKKFGVNVAGVFAELNDSLIKVTLFNLVKDFQEHSTKLGDTLRFVLSRSAVLFTLL
jgi:hypothetical protein